LKTNKGKWQFNDSPQLAVGRVTSGLERGEEIGARELGEILGGEGQDVFEESVILQSVR
jgi:hypothetical protein